MTAIDVFYQREGVLDIEHIELNPDQTFSDLKEILVQKHSLETEVLIFLDLTTTMGMDFDAGVSGMVSQKGEFFAVHFALAQRERQIAAEDNPAFARQPIGKARGQ